MNRSAQSGNVIFIILLGIALFAALSYAVTGSMRGGSNFGGMNDQKAEIVAMDVINWGNQMTTAVAALRANGCTDTQITFENNNGMSKRGSGTAYVYTNSNAPADRSCHVFDVNGGGVTPRLISPDAAVNPAQVNSGWMQSQSWIVSGNRVLGNGDDTNTPNGTDLVLWAGRLKKEVCIKINEKLGVTNPGGSPPSETFNCTIAVFNGSYANCSNPMGDLAEIKGRKSFCLNDPASGTDNGYLYFQVLIAR